MIETDTVRVANAARGDMLCMSDVTRVISAIEQGDPYAAAIASIVVADQVMATHCFALRRASARILLLFIPDASLFPGTTLWNRRTSSLGSTTSRVFTLINPLARFYREHGGE